MSAPRCQAADPSTCADPRCPARRDQQHAALAAVAADNWEAFAAAKKSTKLTWTSVKLPADFRKVVKEKYPDVLLHLSGDGRNSDFVTLGLIKIPEAQRNTGLGTTIMSELVKAADRNGWNLALSPADDWKSSKVRLEVFYRRFGFIANKGRRRDFLTKETMIRYA